MPNIDKITEENFAAPYRTFTESIKFCLANCFNFKGRASRSEYWWFWWLITAVGFVPTDWLDSNYLDSFITWSLFFLVQAVSVRRLHDIGLSGWWVLGIYTPIIILFVLPLDDLLGDKALEYYPEGGYLPNPEYIWRLFLYVAWLLVCFILWLCWFTRAGEPHRNKYNLQS